MYTCTCARLSTSAGGSLEFSAQALMAPLRSRETDHSSPRLRTHLTLTRIVSHRSLISLPLLARQRANGHKVVSSIAGRSAQTRPTLRLLRLRCATIAISYVTRHVAGRAKKGWRLGLGSRDTGRQWCGDSIIWLSSALVLAEREWSLSFVSSSMSSTPSCWTSAAL